MHRVHAPYEVGAPGKSWVRHWCAHLHYQQLTREEALRCMIQWNCTALLNNTHVLDKSWVSRLEFTLKLEILKMWCCQTETSDLISIPCLSRNSLIKTCFRNCNALESQQTRHPSDYTHRHGHLQPVRSTLNGNRGIEYISLLAESITSYTCQGG